MAKRESQHGHPEHRVELEPRRGRVRVSYAGECIADSRRTTLVRETRHEPVVYFPRRDVRFEHLEASDYRSFCPFKGEASYWTIRVGERRAENAVWGYPQPLASVAGLAELVAFYPDRVEWERED